MPETAVVVGVGMHPWVKGTSGFLYYGVHAARAALADGGVSWRDVDLVSAAATMRQGYAGQISAMSYVEALGFQGAEISTSYGACTSGAQALSVAQMRIIAGGSNLALVIGADVAPDRPFTAPSPAACNDPDDLRLKLGLVNPVYLALAARRRIHDFGTTVSDLSAVREKNSRHGARNSNARYRFAVTHEQVNRSPMICDPLRLLHLSSMSSGGAAIVLASQTIARRLGRRSIAVSAVSTASPTASSRHLDMGRLATEPYDDRPDSAAPHAVCVQVYERASIGPDELSLAEVYDLSAVAELEWYEHLGICALGGAEALLRSGVTRLGGRLPVNPSGGLSAFGEAPSAQVLAQVCEIVWQLRGEAGCRQIPKAKIGIATSQGVFGHTAAVLVKRNNYRRTRANHPP